jgi:hypothetical protein
MNEDHLTTTIEELELRNARFQGGIATVMAPSVGREK